MKEIVKKVTIDLSELDKLKDKLETLNSLLKETNSLIKELAETDIKINFFT